MTQVQTATATMFPFAHYQNGTAAIDWLVEAFGFESRGVTQSPDGGIVHAELALGPSVFMLDDQGGEGFGIKTPGELGAVSGGVYVYVEDVDAHFARAKAAGAEIVREPAETSYGAREYMARDLEGHLWSFGTYLPSASSEDG